MRRVFLRLFLLTASTFVLLAEDVKKLTPEELNSAVAAGKYTMLDVRERNELEEFGTVKGYLHIPLGQLEQRLGEIPKGKPVVTLCMRGGRAARAAALLEKSGYKVMGLCGLVDYKERGYELVKPDPVK